MGIMTRPGSQQSQPRLFHNGTNSMMPHRNKGFLGPLVANHRCLELNSNERAGSFGQLLASSCPAWRGCGCPPFSEARQGDDGAVRHAGKREVDPLKPLLRPQVWLAPRAVSLSLFFLLAGALFCAGLAAQSRRPGEYEVKAAFLFNFAKFVQWPESSFDGPEAPIVFEVMGGDQELAFDLRRISAGQKVQGRNILIREGRFGDDVRRCHVLFISTSERQRTSQILASLQNATVLTVSDIDGFADAGGAMQLVMEDGRVHFIVNLNAATQSQLRVSAKLLALAHVINHSESAR